MPRKQRASRGNWFRLAGEEGRERRLELEKMLAPHELSALGSWHWEVWGRDEQHPPQGPWRVWLIKAGRGFGKTRAGAEWVRNVARHDPEARIALLGASLVEVRSVMVEGESGVLAASPGALAPDFEPSLRRLQWPNGAQAYLYSAGEPESLRGPQHSHACSSGTEGSRPERGTHSARLLAAPVGGGPTGRAACNATGRPVLAGRFRGQRILDGPRRRDRRIQRRGLALSCAASGHALLAPIEPTVAELRCRLDRTRKAGAGQWRGDRGYRIPQRNPDAHQRIDRGRDFLDMRGEPEFCLTVWLSIGV